MEPLTVESLKTHHLSRLRNRRMADIFYRSGAIESWGRGTLNILDIAKEGGYPQPVFEEFMGGLTVRFQRMVFKDIPDHVTDYVTDSNDRENMMMQMISENSRISLMQLAKQLSVTKMTVIRDMEKLKNKGLIRRKGKAKDGYWEIII